jgi:hypothetical protein
VALDATARQRILKVSHVAPLQVALRTPLTKALYDWAIAGESVGQLAVVAYGIDQRESHRLNLVSPIVSELALDPKLDRRSSPTIFLTFKAEDWRLEIGSKKPLPVLAIRAATERIATVRLLVQGFEAALTRVRSLDRVVLQASTAAVAGSTRRGAAAALGAGTPTRIGFEVAPADAAPFVRWLEDLAAGQREKSVPGVLQLLDAEFKVVGGLDLLDLSPVSVELPFIRNEEARSFARIGLEARETRVDLRGLLA